MTSDSLVTFVSLFSISLTLIVSLLICFLYDLQPNFNKHLFYLPHMAMNIMLCIRRVKNWMCWQDVLGLLQGRFFQNLYKFLVKSSQNRVSVYKRIPVVRQVLGKHTIRTSYFDSQNRMLQFRTSSLLIHAFLPLGSINLSISYYFRLLRY